MAPTFRHGKGATALIGRFNMTPYMRMNSVAASCDAADVTHYAQNDKNFIPGLTNVTASFGGLFSFATGAASTEVDAVLQRALGGSTQLVCTVGPEGNSTGQYAFMFKGDQTKLDVTEPLTDAISIAADIQGSDGYDGGVWLLPLTARTSTGSGGTVAFAGSTVTGFSTGGGVGHFHLVSATTLTVGVTVKVQHSTSGSTWADLITFTAATAETFQRSTVAGNVKEKLRGTTFVFTGGASKTATYALAFARRGKQRG